MGNERNSNGNNRNASNERRRHLISINNQIDRIQDVYFRNYTQNIDRRISSLAERQSRMLGQLYDTIDAEERDRLQRSFADRQDALRRSLEDWRSYNQQIRSDLTLADRFASNVFYWNRRRDLRDLEREARYRFDDIRDEADSLSEDMSSMFSSVTDTLRDWATALNVNQLASGMEDTQKSMRDIRIEMQKYVDLNEADWKALRNQANEFSKSTDYAISNTEYLERMSEVLAVYDDKEFASKVAGAVSKANYFGVDAQSLGGLFEVAKGNADYVSTTISQMMRIQRTDGLFTNASDLASAIDESKAYIQQLTSDPEKQAEMLQQAMALKTAANASWLDGVDTKLFEIMSTPLSEMSNEILMLGGQQIQALMQSGDYKTAAEIYTSNLSAYLNKNFGSDAARTEFLNALGLTDTEFQAKIMQGENISDFFEAYDQTMSILDEEANAATKFVDTWNNSGATALEKFNNQFKTSEVGEFLDDVANELDITLTEAMLIGSGILQVGKLLTGGVKGLGRLVGIGGNASGAAGATRSILGFSSGGSGVINHSLLGSTGNAMVSGSGLLGGLSSAGSSLVAAGGGGAVSGGAAALAGGASIAGGIIGGASIISGIVDIASASNEVTWQEEADKVTEGAIKVGGTAAAAGVGAAIGSIVPGVGTAVGALVGAGVGGLATLIWGDDWAQQLSDSLDGTKKMNEALENLQSSSAELDKTLKRRDSFDDLMDSYESLKSDMELLNPETQAYKDKLDQLNGIISSINEIYPGLIDVSSEDYAAKENAIQTIDKLTEAELKLAKARAIGSVGETTDALSAAYNQLDNSNDKVFEDQMAANAAEQLATQVAMIEDFIASGELVLDDSGLRATHKASSNAKSALTAFETSAYDLWQTGQFGYDWDGVNWIYSDNENAAGVLRSLRTKGNTSKVAESYATNVADATAKQAYIESTILTEISNLESALNGETWQELASRYSSASASDRSALLALGQLFRGVRSSEYGLFPDMAELENLAGVDFSGEGKIGSYATGLDRVPYDEFPAYLHKDEAVLTAEEAEIWRQASAGWAPNDKAQLLSPGDTIIVNQSSEVSEDNDDDASISEVIDTLKWLAKEIKKSIEDNSSNSNNTSSTNSLLALLLKSRMSSNTDSVYNFIP